MVAITVWGVKGSTCTDRAMFTAHELGVPIAFVQLDFMAGQHKQPEHLARQPFGKWPAADVDGQPMYESRAIAKAIARSTPAGERLYPSSDLKRVAVFEQWASLEQGTITPIFERVFLERVSKKRRGMQTDEQLLKQTLEEGQTAFQVLDKQLSVHEYVAGDFSLVDIFLSTCFSHFVSQPEYVEFSTKYSNIAAWWQRVSARPAWQQVVAEGWKPK